MIFGTPEYMSPEQAQGSPPDHRVDVYAIGCIMYHLLTGQVPFTADNFMGILTKHLLEAPVPPRKRRPDLDIMPDVEAICLRAMEKDRDKRFADMDALYRALGAAGGMPFEPSAVFVPPRMPKASLKYPTLAAANLEARESRTAIATGSGTFEDERPGRPDETPAGSRKSMVIAMVVGGLALAAVGLVLALRPSSKVTPPAETAAAAEPAPANAAAPPPASTAPAVPAAPPQAGRRGAAADDRVTGVDQAQPLTAPSRERGGGRCEGGSVASPDPGAGGVHDAGRSQGVSRQLTGI